MCFFVALLSILFRTRLTLSLCSPCNWPRKQRCIVTKALGSPRRVQPSFFSTVTTELVLSTDSHVGDEVVK